MTKSNGKMIIGVDVTPWKIENDELEYEITDRDSLVKLATSGQVTSSQAARLAIVQRELGLAQEDVLPPNDRLLNNGGTLSLDIAIASRFERIELANGTTHQVREFVGVVKVADDNQEVDTELSYVAPSPVKENTFVHYKSDAGKQRTLDYLFKTITGSIYRRLTNLASNGEDVRAIAEDLKAEIDKIVERLS